MMGSARQGGEREGGRGEEGKKEEKKVEATHSQDPLLQLHASFPLRCFLQYVPQASTSPKHARQVEQRQVQLRKEKQSHQRDWSALNERSGEGENGAEEGRKGRTRSIVVAWVVEDSSDVLSDEVVGAWR